ncbi:unnamed protein product [Urochloa humidicola]
MAIRSYEDVPVFSGPRKAIRTVCCIPNDIIFNILLQLPSKSVIRCKSVCKTWLAIISSQHFIRAHLEFSKVRSTIIVVSRTYKEWQREGMDSLFMGFYRYHGDSKAELVHSQHIPRGIGFWASPLHCDGLILVSTQKVTVVCNPATKEFVNLPKGSDSICKSRVGFGFDPCSNKYKAARFFYEMENGKSETVCRFEVLTLGTNIWRRIADPPYPIFGITPAHVRGSLYWRINLPSPKHPKAFVMFSLAEENFSLTPYPPSEAEPINFVELEGKLCCACFKEQYEVVEIWTLDSDGLQKWTQCCTVHIPKDIILPLPQGELKRLVASVQHFHYCDSDNNRYKIFLGNELACHAVNYNESLVPIGGYP